MTFREQVAQLVQDFLATRDDLYLVELKITPDDNITIILDGDQGVNLQDCLDASRAVEFNLDKEVYDFGLQVMSPGLSEPLTLPRQFKKNMGRDLDITLQDDEKIEGELTSITDEGIVLTLRYRRPKLVGKGKEDVVEERLLLFPDIKKALVVIKF